MNFRILIAEDEDITRKHLIHTLTREGYEVVGTSNGREALDNMERGHFDLLITDIKMPRMSGLELLDLTRQRYQDMEVLVITGFGSIDTAVEAMKKGAYDYIPKPFNLDELALKVRNLYERKMLRSENTALKAHFGMNKGVSIIARSETMQKIMTLIEDMRDSDSNVFLTGESGVGKTLLARVIHFTSRRQNMPFLSVYCGTLPYDVLEKEMFGSEESVSGGDITIIRGMIELADHGTLFLDDVTGLSPDLQLRLLRVMEEGVFYRCGGARQVRADVRFIAATHQDVRGLIAEGGFHEKLYYRLNVMDILIPPLREHGEDIVPLAEYFLKKHLRGLNKSITGFTEEALKVLTGYSYPGNIRELENIVERAVILEKGGLIGSESLPRSIRMFQIETFGPESIRTIDEITRDYARRVLELVDGDKAKAARLLGVTELGLYRLLKDG